ncbi:uncharacterized protein (DUF488 family) [Bradyrhizobium sp. AZCC 1578]|uniref:DUF488 domain-containing protein n=1 Tax=Bradyrhizobium sp. AZCC 1578 TaxID=3117027 RepID=UPI002FEEA093
MINKQIQTFGYEGLTIQAFIEHLKGAGTRIVIDVRANPLSRKHGFSKKAFASYLEKAGIQYMHAPGVGCPKTIRDRYRADGNWSAYTIAFMKYLKSRGDDVAAIATVSKDAAACLVCFEADFERCHRKFVAEAVAASAGLSVDHLSRTALTAGVRPAA